MVDALSEFASSFEASSSRRDGGLAFRPGNREEAVRGARLAHRLGLRFASTPSVGVQLDLSGLDRILEIDERSGLVHAEVGASLGSIEANLATRGRSLMTAASRSLTLAEYLATGCAGARGVDDDPVGQHVAGLEAVTLDGRLLEIRPAPRRAVGPDWINAILASDWSIAIPLSAHLVARQARSLHALGYRFATEEDASSALAWMRGRGVRPAHTRLRLDAGGALLSIWLEADRLLSPMQRIVTEEARSRGGSVAEPDDHEADVPSPRPSPALAPFEAALREGR
jgi:FAD/FMN-containing dehydrogenase